MGKGTARILGSLAFFAMIALLQQHNLVNADDDKGQEPSWFNFGGGTTMDAVSNAAVDAATYASEHVGKIASGGKAEMANTFKGPDGAEGVDKAANAFKGGVEVMDKAAKK